MTQLILKNLSFTEGKEVRIYRVSKEGRIEVDPSEFTKLDADGNSVGIVLKSAYDVSCVGAIPFAGLITASGLQRDDVASFHYTNGKDISVKVDGTLADLATSLAEKLGLTIYHYTNPNDPSMNDLFIVNDIGSTDVHFRLQVNTEGVGFGNWGIEGAVVIETNGDVTNVANVCLSPKPEVGTTTSRPMTFQHTESSLVLTNGRGSYGKPPEGGDGVINTVIRREGLEKDEYAPSTNQDENLARGGVSIYYDKLKPENGYRWFTGPWRGKFATVVYAPYRPGTEDYASIQILDGGAPSDGVPPAFRNIEYNGRQVLNGLTELTPNIGAFDSAGNILVVSSWRSRIKYDPEFFLGMASPVVGLASNGPFFLDLSSLDESSEISDFIIDVNCFAKGVNDFVTVLLPKGILVGKIQPYDEATGMEYIDYTSMTHVDLGIDLRVQTPLKLLVDVDDRYPDSLSKVYLLTTSEMDYSIVTFVVDENGVLTREGETFLNITPDGVLCNFCFDGSLINVEFSDLICIVDNANEKITRIKTLNNQAKPLLAKTHDDLVLIYSLREEEDYKILEITAAKETSGFKTYMVGECIIENALSIDELHKYIIFNSYSSPIEDGTDVNAGVGFLYPASTLDKDLNKVEGLIGEFVFVLNGEEWRHGVSKNKFRILAQDLMVGPITVLNEDINVEGYSAISLYQASRDDGKGLENVSSNSEVIIQGGAYQCGMENPMSFESAYPFITISLSDQVEEMVLIDGENEIVNSDGLEVMFQEAGLDAVVLSPAEIRE